MRDTPITKDILNDELMTQNYRLNELRKNLYQLIINFQSQLNNIYWISLGIRLKKGLQSS